MLSRFRFCTLCALVLAFCPGPAAGAEVLRVVTPSLHPSSAGHAVYFPQLLRLALDKTRDEAPFEITEIDLHLTSPRQATDQPAARNRAVPGARVAAAGPGRNRRPQAPRLRA